MQLDRPTYIGAAIFDLSKKLIYDFHYRFIKKQMQQSNSKLLYTDAGRYFLYIFNSLIYKITNIDPYSSDLIL